MQITLEVAASLWHRVAKELQSEAKTRIYRETERNLPVRSWNARCVIKMGSWNPEVPSWNLPVRSWNARCVIKMGSWNLTPFGALKL